MLLREFLVIVFALVLIGCSARPRPAKPTGRFEFRNLHVNQDGTGSCEEASTAQDARSGRLIVFCK
jgi:hypothetical protein